MDFVVHINDGSETVKPIVLRLLPGEETLFNLKVVNHGEPSNISLEASDTVLKAVRLNKPDRYVVMEETVPIMARMPANISRLDGEILLSSSEGESRVPISLLREPEDPGDDLDDPGVRGEPDWKDDLEGDESDLAEDEDEDEWEEKLEEDKDAEDEGEVKRIRFSRDRDLQRYRAAQRPRNGAGNLADKTELSTEAAASLPGRQEDSQSLQQDRGREERENSFPIEATTAPETAEEEDSSPEGEGGIFESFNGWWGLQVIPAVIFLLIIVVLALTFITASIPEFPGALASSILIVTLIIYGAATLLKA